MNGTKYCFGPSNPRRALEEGKALYMHNKGQSRGLGKLLTPTWAISLHSPPFLWFPSDFRAS